VRSVEFLGLTQRVFVWNRSAFCRAMWEALNKTRPLLINAGIELAPMIRSQNPLNVWLPDLFLTTAKSIDVLDETIRLRPGGAMFWSRHVVATIQENSFRKPSCVVLALLQLVRCLTACVDTECFVLSCPAVCRDRVLRIPQRPPGHQRDGGELCLSE
jgi:hypothetical protein